MEQSKESPLNLSPPEVTVSSDCFFKNRSEYGQTHDPFMLEQRLEPIFDIVRHRDTDGPLNVALYGGAGTGKTTALRWLKEKMESWNRLDAAAREGHPQVLPVWISARILQEARSVESRLICELLLSCLSLNGTLHPDSRKESLSQALHLEEELSGTPFRQGLTALSRAWSVPAKFTEGSKPGDLTCLGFFQRYFKFCPQTGAGVRTVLLIDDLDFSPPDVMIAVFNALELHLIPFGLVSVAALDAGIGQSIVTRHFEQHGYDGDRSRLYLSKIFQAEIHIAPGRVHMDRYFEYEFDLLNNKTGGMLAAQLPDAFKEALRNAIFHLAKMNPRKIKLLLKSALMTGYGIMRGSGQTGGVAGVTVAQGMQVYLLQRWLNSFSAEGGGAIYREDVLEWFDQLSQAVCEPDFSMRKISSPGEGDGAHPGASAFCTSGEAYRSLHRITERFPPPDGLNCASIPAWILELLTIPFSKQTVCRVCTVEAAVPLPSLHPPIKEVADGLPGASQILKDALAAELQKKVKDLLPDDVSRISKMDLSRQEIEPGDWEILGRMVNLEHLNLHSTAVQELRWVSGLVRLKSLNLSCTSVHDICALAGLKTLAVLDLSYSRITDLTPLRECTGLESLILYGTEVQDLEPIGGLSRLSCLNLSHTKVADQQLAVIELLPELKTLFLRETDVSRERAVKLRESIGYGVRIDF